jgi:hypothetical protein
MRHTVLFVIILPVEMNWLSIEYILQMLSPIQFQGADGGLARLSTKRVGALSVNFQSGVKLSVVEFQR